MAIIIPKAQEQVQPNAVRISTPQVGSNAQPSAFGTMTGEADAKLGDALTHLGSVLGQRIIERQHLDAEQKVMAAHNSFNLSLQDSLYNPEVGADGKPNGILNRQLDFAKGSTVELDAQYTKLRKSYIDQMPDDPMKAALAARMDRDYVESRHMVIRHEAQQDQEGFKVQFHTMLERDPVLAQKVLDNNKARLPETMFQSLKESVDGKKLADQQNGLWNSMTSGNAFRLPDGNWDMDKMRVAVDGLQEPQAKKEKLFDYLRSRANEDLINRHRLEEAQDRQSFNAILAARQGGQPLDQALKIATASGRDAYDVLQKQDFAKKVYAPPAESEKGVYLSLWEGIQDGTVKDIKAIDKAKDGNLLSPNDWVALRKEFRTNLIEGKNPASKLAWDRVNALADEKYGSDKTGKEQFLYVMHSQATGKAPDEIITIAQDNLKRTSLTGGTVWKDVLGRMDANAAKQYQQRISGSITEQTPRLNAITSLANKGKAITPEAIDAVLRIYPDGNWK